MIADVLALIDFLGKNKDKYTTRSALFNAQGQKIEGHKDVDIEILRSPDSATTWFYRLKPMDDYVFMVMPVISCYTDYGTPANQLNPNSEYFRFVGNPLSTFQVGGSPNLSVNFVVIGYKPKQLLNRLEK